MIHENDVCDLVTDARMRSMSNCSNAPLDFTPRFEHLVLGLGINSLFLMCLVLKIWQSHKSSFVTLPSKSHILKLAFSGLLTVIQVAYLVFRSFTTSEYFLPGQVLNVLCTVLVVVLVVVENRRTIRPSSVLILYLLSTLIVDAILLRTLLLQGHELLTVSLLPASIACKAILLFLEHLPRTFPEKTKHEYSPEELSGILGRVVFWYMNPLLRLGNKKILALDDLYPLNHEFRSESLELSIEAIWKGYKLRTTYRLIYTILSFMKTRFLLTVLPTLAESAFKFSQPFLIKAIILYIEKPANERDPNEPYMLLIATATVFIGMGLTQGQYDHKIYQIQIAARGGITSLIFGKALTASANSHDLAPLTLMSTDVDRIIDGLIALYSVWIRLLEVFVGIWLLWRQLGPVSIAPTLTVFAFFFIQTWASKSMGVLQARWVAAVQRRVTIATNIVRSMKSVKLAGLVESMEALLASEREREIAFAKAFRYILVGINMISNFPSIFSGVIVFAGYAIESSIKHTPPLTTSKAFTALAIIGLMTQPTAMLLITIPRTIAALGCIDRVEKFLLAEDFDDKRQISEESNGGSAHHDNSGVMSATNLIVKKRSESENGPRPISFSVKRGNLTIVVGPVGCGKSTLLRCLLGEVVPESGSVSIKTPFVGYCAQFPWLQNTTIKDNIVGALEFDEAWYKNVVTVCALDYDLSQMPLKDKTEVGSKGLKLSGGQKQRIALARALYSRSSILILDDFLSGLDERTRHFITHQLFSTDGHAKQHGCTVILATHATKHMSSADSLLVLDKDGGEEYFGSPQDWEGFEEQPTQLARDEDDPSPSLNGKASKSQIQVQQIAVSDSKDQSKRQTGDIRDWLYYSKSIGPIQIVIASISIIATCFGLQFHKLWLKWATETNMALGWFLGVYTVSMLATAVTMALSFGYMILIIAPTSAINLHKILTRSVMHAPMSFLELTESSILVNRFSQDMALIDLQLPITMFQLLISITSSLIMISFICLGSSYMAASVPFTMVILWYLQKFYLRTSRQMRVLELEAKSPVYKIFTETLEGVLTIRAFGWQSFFNTINLIKLDDSQKPYYQLFCLQRWLSVTLSLTVSVIGTLMVGLAVFFPYSSTSGNIGVALTSVLGFNSQLEFFITSWTAVEQNMGAVTRTREFEEETPNEDAEQESDIDPGEEWPAQGSMTVSDVSMTYDDGTKALKGVSFNITAGQKVGIAGRTGSGKSTLLSCLLRLVDPSAGTITIDDIPIHSVSRNLLRTRLICLPQDALLFTNTFRFNLNPLAHPLSSEEITSALQLVGLSDLVSSRGGLDAEMAPDSLSAGEQQILAIARAVLRRRAAKGKCVLVLDEATSNIDAHTQDVIQKVIDTEFQGHTVITVAHRLETIKDSDVVIVLDKGEISKIGKPQDVL